MGIGKNIRNVTRSVKLLVIIIDHELKFAKHVAKLCQKVSKKISAFLRIVPHMDWRRKQGNSCTIHL